MKKNLNNIRWNHAIIYSCLLAISFNISSCTSKEKYPSDFNFIAIWGIAKEYSLNTFTNAFSLNWSIDTSVVFNLSDLQKQKIYNYIIEKQIYKYPRLYTPESNRSISPYSCYYIKIEYNRQQIEIIWEANCWADDRKSKKLRGLFTLIEEITLKDKAITTLKDQLLPIYSL
jgi:hypothetical protein